MTTADAVRARLGLGRLLPLGGAADGAWLTEHAADAVLRLTAARVPGVAPGRIRLALLDPATAGPAALPPPPSALPPGPLLLRAEFAATTLRPLPAVASDLREALFAAATDLLDLAVEEVDLRVTELIDTAPGPFGPPSERHGTAVPPSEGRPAHPGGASGRPAGPEDGAEAGAGTADRGGTDTGEGAGAGSGAASPAGASAASPGAVAARAAATAAGVAALTSVLGSPVHLAHDHVRVEIVTAPGHRPLSAVHAVRAAVSTALADGRPVSVLVTAVSV